MARVVWPHRWTAILSLPAFHLPPGSRVADEVGCAVEVTPEQLSTDARAERQVLESALLRSSRRADPWATSPVRLRRNTRHYSQSQVRGPPSPHRRDPSHTRATGSSQPDGLLRGKSQDREAPRKPCSQQSRYRSTHLAYPGSLRPQQSSRRTRSDLHHPRTPETGRVAGLQLAPQVHPRSRPGGRI